MRIALLTAATVLLPFAAGATPIYDFVDVHYEGTVNFLDPWGERGFIDEIEIGDGVTGTLRINLHKVPADTFPDDPTRAAYIPDPSLDWPSFVSGYAPVGNREVEDRIQIQDGFGGRDLFDVVDHENSLLPGDFRITNAVALRFSSDTVDFVHGDGAVQDFEVTGDQGDATTFGEFQTVRGPSSSNPSEWLGGIVRFAISKLSVKPGRCKR